MSRGETDTLAPPLRFSSGERTQTREGLEARLDKLRRACGCNEGMIGLALGLGFSWWLYFSAGDYSGLWGKIPATIGIALAGAVLGKFGSLMWVYAQRTKLEARLRALGPESGR